jgi:hypothetical protein
VRGVFRFAVFCISVCSILCLCMARILVNDSFLLLQLLLTETLAYASQAMPAGVPNRFPPDNGVSIHCPRAFAV